VPKEILINTFYMNSPSQSWTGLWSHPDANGLRYTDVDFWTDLAKRAERGLLDGIFMADSIGAFNVYEGKPDAVIRAGGMFPIGDPMMVIPIMTAVTEHLGFGVTANTGCEPPYLLARRLSTLDHLSKGRVAWNVVTGPVPSAAKAMGTVSVSHDKRYDIADEYMDLMYKLWEQSWEVGSVVRDKNTQIFADPAQVHVIQHRGESYACEGIHMCEPSPQRTPFIYAAGASRRGSAFAGKHAEAAFMSAYEIGYAKQVVDGYRAAAVAAGRRPTDIKVFNATTIIVAATDAEALELQEEYQRYTSIAGNLSMASAQLGIDLARYAPDDPIEYIDSNAVRSVVEAMTKYNKGNKVRVRDLARFAGMPGREGFIVGSAQNVCDTMIRWVEEAGVDGFTLLRTVEPAGLDSFIDLVIPELQNRGYYKTAYRQGSMREKTFLEGGPHLPSNHYGASFRRSS
jgi:long-chain alkane monooxygenase